MQQLTKSLILTVLLTGLYAASAGRAAAQQKYDFGAPTAVFELDDELEEISALSAGPEGLLLAVQDEEGYIYRLDPDSGDVIRRDRFSGKGDYEGIEWVGAWIYVLESNGDLFRTPADQPSRSETLRIRLDLPPGCNAEGLGWNAEREEFLVACKDADGRRGVKGRSVFTFERNGTLKGIALFVSEANLEAVGIDGVEDFRSSAVAVEPVSGRVFLLASHAPTLCQVDAGKLACDPLSLKTMRQPEGIAFDANGRLWISSEARGKKPTLHRFDPINP